ncbi:hypothetical protein ACFPRL_05820 [Pseudoclavibacter helvolus]
MSKSGLSAHPVQASRPHVGNGESRSAGRLGAQRKAPHEPELRTSVPARGELRSRRPLRACRRLPSCGGRSGVALPPCRALPSGARPLRVPARPTAEPG